jgi:FecR protein
VSVPLETDRPSATDLLEPLDQPIATSSDADRSMRRRQRLAWTILILASAVFCGLFAGLSLGARWYREQATSPRYATLEIIGNGTVLYQSEEAVREAAAIDRQRLQDGDRIRTTADGQALISLADGSNVRLWPYTEAQIRQLRASTYTTTHTLTLLNLNAGHLRAEVAPPSTLERRFEIQTPQGRALLREGSYRVEVDAQGTELGVRTGSASVSAREQSVEVIRGERTIVGPNERPSPPSDGVRNLVLNGDFTRGFDRWQQGSRREEDGVSGRVFLEPADGRYYVRMRRQGSQKHGETFVQQQINRDVTDETSLRLIMDVKIASHTLSGGGVLGSEYPLLVRLKYRDAYGSEAELVRGFYLANPDGRPTTNGMQIPANQWLPITLDLFDEKKVSPRPAQLLWVEIESSGWEYEAFVTGIQLLAE